MSRIKEIWNNTTDELVNKVSWPTWDELQNSTIIVLVASIIFAVAIWLMDQGFGFITETIYDLI